MEGTLHRTYGKHQTRGEIVEETITPEERMKLEETIQEKTDEQGHLWRKVYFGGGSHMKNWLDQIREVHGEENVMVEEADSTGFQCYEEGGEKMYRIWARQTQ